MGGNCNEEPNEPNEMRNSKSEIRNKPEYSTFGIRACFELRVSDFGFRHGIPFQRRSPHSDTKHTRAKPNITGVCQSGTVHDSIMGACFCGNPRTNSSSLFAGMISPPLFFAIASRSATFGLSERNSSA